MGTRNTRTTVAGLASLGILMAALYAADAKKPYYFLSSAEREALEAKMRASLDATKGSHEDLMPTTNSYFMIFHREGSAANGEIHEKLGDFGYIRAGEGTIQTGGKLTGSKTSAPNELRGKLEGGVNRKLSTGDVFYIPAGMPHHVLVEPGKKFTVEMIKVEQKAGAHDFTEYKSWTAAQIGTSVGKLKHTMDEYKNGVENLLQNDYFVAMVNYKEGTGLSEIHEHLGEFQLIRSGVGAIMLGGKVVKPKNTEPGEIRGTALEGAVKQSLLPGDLIYFPPGTPHHTMVESGKTQDKLVLKVWVH